MVTSIWLYVAIGGAAFVILVAVVLYFLCRIGTGGRTETSDSGCEPMQFDAPESMAQSVIESRTDAMTTISGPLEPIELPADAGRTSPLTSSDAADERP
jgi:hypothetical protein